MTLLVYARKFVNLVKFEHSIFALPYAYIGALYAFRSADSGGALFLAANPTMFNPWMRFGGWPTPLAVLWITLAMVGARALAFVVNRAVDKEIDARNPRTAGRAVPAGLVKAGELWLFAAVMLAAYGLAVYNLAPITHWLWPVPLAMFIVYPYIKRFSPLAHFWLGACLGLGAVGGWAAVTDTARTSARTRWWA